MMDPQTACLIACWAFINGAAMGAALVMAQWQRSAIRNQPLNPKADSIGLSEELYAKFKARVRASEGK